MKRKTGFVSISKSGMVHRSKVDIYNLEVIILNAKLSIDSPMTGLAQTSSNSMIKLADKVAIFEIKEKQTTTTKENDNKTNPTQSKRKISNLEMKACFPR